MILIKFTFALLTLLLISSAAPAERTQLSVVAGDTPRSVRITGPKSLTDLGKRKYGKWVGCSYSIQWATARNRQRALSAPTTDKGCRTPIGTQARIELSRKLFIPRLMIAILMTGSVKPSSWRNSGVQLRDRNCLLPEMWTARNLR